MSVEPRCLGVRHLICHLRLCAQDQIHARCRPMIQSVAKHSTCVGAVETGEEWEPWECWDAYRSDGDEQVWLRRARWRWDWWSGPQRPHRWTRATCTDVGNVSKSLTRLHLNFLLGVDCGGGWLVHLITNATASAVTVVTFIAALLQLLYTVLYVYGTASNPKVSAGWSWDTGKCIYKYNSIVVNGDRILYELTHIVP